MDVINVESQFKNTLNNMDKILGEVFPYYQDAIKTLIDKSFEKALLGDKDQSGFLATALMLYIQGLIWGIEADCDNCLYNLFVKNGVKNIKEIKDYIQDNINKTEDGINYMKIWFEDNEDPQPDTEENNLHVS